MSLTVSFHFSYTPIVKHDDFPESSPPFTCATLVDGDGTEHKIFLPLGCRLTVSKEQSHE